MIYIIYNELLLVNIFKFIVQKYIHKTIYASTSVIL